MSRDDPRGQDARTRTRLDIGVVGTGISGLACSWLLTQSHDLTVYESADRVGGHANTVEVATQSGGMPIDTGFIVYNEVTYPNLTALFRHLNVPTRESDMSFAVSIDEGRMEYAGTNLLGLFAQKRNLARPRFWGMLRDLMRFYREARRDLPMLERDLSSLDDYLRLGRYGAALRDEHLLPMAAAIWSCPAHEAGLLPAASFIRFCDNHGLLQVANRPVWRTVTGGSRAYLARLTAPFAKRIMTNQPVLGIERLTKGVRVTTPSGARVHDHVVLACHADEALALLAGGATAGERDRLGAFRYTRNVAVLHTDTGLMPKRRGVWASWNYLGRSEVGDRRPCVSYWMNRLQGLPRAGGDHLHYFVTLNPPRPPRPGTLLRTEIYTHPVFDPAAIRAQRILWQGQNEGGVWFCGAYFGAGFHEDGLQAGLAVAEALGGCQRPWSVANPSGRIHLNAPDERDAAPEVSR